MGLSTAAAKLLSPAFAASAASAAESAPSLTSTSRAATSRLCAFVRYRAAAVHTSLSFPAAVPLNSLAARVVTASAGVSRARSARLNAGRSVHYETADTYVFIAPGEEEVFLSRPEVLQCLLNELKSWKKEGRRLSDDLAVFESLEEAAEFLLDSACELELGGGKGAFQWFEVRLEPNSSE
ncbi:hypothetical protein CLOM_g1566 [Closterium sp. NIES-68]|nr:hypothetical protein CLOM_g1566 [Closterium sp. NIES-68]GJP85966.1 hypothetical protein CLOP_g16049 [Closterium sp. NIES-67]